MATVEITSHGSTIALDGRRLRINRADAASAHVPIDDVDFVILQVPAVGVSGAALAALASAGIPVLLCDDKHLPAAWLHPLGVADVFDPDRARRQAGLPERTRDRLWRGLVIAKIAAQADLLSRRGSDVAARVARLSGEVKEGDADNREALAAQLYWPGLFGRDFRRRGDGPIAGALDWGYAVLRALVCRSLVVGGLYPAIGLHHRSAGNAFNLADDLIEPYRPLVDEIVVQAAARDPALPPALWKPDLAALGEIPVELDGKILRARAAIGETIASLARIIDSGKGALALPRRIGGIEHAGRMASDVVDGVL
ncbi:MAG: type II CRISPR-associated endonuclease Cas1 [Alphaproteobacteria bacterium]|nr:type II CRISPR-associated endonuclease Cas1 [Alphaproteobacteria bacterium]